MRRTILLGTGGTIASREGDGGRRVDVGARELLHAARRVRDLDGMTVEARDAASVVSFAATVPDVLALAESVREAAGEADGVVITHGTDTLEESAFLLSLVHTGPVPVVLTGAQRPFTDPAPDGPRNLAAALLWAAAPEAADTGVTVAFADRILPAVGVRKTHSLAVNAFAAPGRGPVGYVDESGLRRLGTVPRATILPPGLSDLPRVDVVSQYLGLDPAQIRQAVDGGARGLVVAAFGSGNATPETTSECVRLLDAGIPVLVASRTGEGPVTGLYAGGSAGLAAAGAVFAGDLSPWQARLLLAAVLATEDDPARVATRCLEWLRSNGAVPQAR